MKILMGVAGCFLTISGLHAIDWHVVPEGAAGGDGSAGKPFISLQAAMDALPAAPSEALVLKMAPGTYRIGEALQISPAHLRGRPLRIEGGGKAVISGGRRLTEWTIENGRWNHRLEGVAVCELFVNGKRAARSRFPKAGWARVAEALPDKRSGFTAQDDLPPAKSAELLFLHDWSISRIPVASIEGRLLKTSGPIGFPAAHFVIDHYEKHPRFCLEDDVSFLTEPGTWCNQPTSQTLTYLPRPGETLENTVFEIPIATQVLRVSGSKGEPLRDLRFDGIAFEHCRFDLPPSGYAEGQATKHVPRDAAPGNGDPHGQWKFVPWAITVEHAENVVFHQCRIRSMGGGGILLGTDTRSCVVQHGHIADISGNGIGIGEGGERRGPDGRSWQQAAPEEAATGNRVEHCLVEHCGQQFHGAVGIWVGLAKDSRIVRNEVRHHPYTGISVGWMWNPNPSPCGGNIVEGNHIHHVMQLLSDGGGIYTLGRQPGTRLRDNLIHDVPLNSGRAESNGMFLDEGSSEFLIENNLIYGTDRSPLRFHKARKITVRGNHWTLPEGTPPLRFNATDPAVVDAADNTAIAPGAMETQAKEWLARHPAASAMPFD
jgi:hypothetical protein